MSIYKKLFEAKKEIGAISKDSKNPFYKSKYFDINQLLEHVEPILQKHGLLVLQPILLNKVNTIIYDVIDNSSVESILELTDQKDPQKKGSEITYYRRYTLASLLGLQAVDDDANATTKNPSAPKPEVKINWLSDEGFKTALNMKDKNALRELIKLWSSNTHKMKKEYKEALIEHGKSL